MPLFQRYSFGLDIHTLIWFTGLGVDVIVVVVAGSTRNDDVINNWVVCVWVLAGGECSLVVFFAQQLCVAAKCELVARDQLPWADGTPETVDVEDVWLGFHHEIVTSKHCAALGTAAAEQPTTTNESTRLLLCIGCLGVAQWLLVRTSVFGWRTFPDLCLIYGWHVTTSWVRCPLCVHQPGQLSLSSLRGR